jgi:hypothetical protein
MGSIVLIGAEKSGVGTSMLPYNLAAWAATRGASVVVLAPGLGPEEPVGRTATCTCLAANGQRGWRVIGRGR